MDLPESTRRRTPLMTHPWMENLRRMREHHHAPRWNCEVGDRLEPEDLAFVRAYAARLESERKAQGPQPRHRLIEWMTALANRSAWFSERLAKIDPARDFAEIEPMTRDDLRRRLAAIIPADEDLSRLIVNPTSGTTGCPLAAPSHPRAQGCYDPHIQFALRRHGLSAHYDHTVTAAVQVCAQRNTIVYAAVHSYLDGAGFVKINLRPDQWPSPQSPARYIESLAPIFLSGDPFAFDRLLETDLDYHPGALLSTALAVDEELRHRLTDRFQCPIVELYSSNETGPIAYSAVDRPGWFSILPVDMHVEIIDKWGRPVPDGTEGEITVTGGRNPYLPLLRYRTGDRGVMIRSHDAADPLPLLRLSRSRRLLIFDIPGGGYVNPIDVARILSRYTIDGFRCIQNRNGAVKLRLRPRGRVSDDDDIRQELTDLWEGRAGITITHDLAPDDAGDVFVKEDA